MPPEDSPLRDLDDARELIAGACFPLRPEASPIGCVGIEAEAFPIRIAGDWHPAGRVLLEDVNAVLSRCAAPFGRFSVEPGAQVEHSTAIHPTASGAVRELERGLATLARAFNEDGAVLAGAGLDVWHEPRSVPQQLDVPRYRAMEAYFARRGASGGVMMRHTCSLQVNLDLGVPDDAWERWLVANLAAPLVTATFACSPVPGAVCGRALAWLALDPTRTGVPRLLTVGVADPVLQMTDLALRADVLLVRTARGDAVAGRPGWTFEHWLREGHPQYGRPTAADLRYHLTTLFPEVRPRGFLEIRSADALPPRWRAVPVTLLVGMLYDDGARGAVRAVLERHRPSLPRLLRRAAVVGVADPVLCALAVETWSLALAGARRLPPGFVATADLVRTETFLDRFTVRGRSPSDELRERLATSPASALAWATEPVEELSLR